MQEAFIQVVVANGIFYLIASAVLYWIIRLAVRHGIRDSRRPSAAERAAEVSEALRRHEGE